MVFRKLRRGIALICGLLFCLILYSALWKDNSLYIYLNMLKHNPLYANHTLFANLSADKLKDNSMYFNTSKDVLLTTHESSTSKNRNGTRSKAAEVIHMSSFWSTVRGLVKGDTLYPKDFDVTKVINSLRHTKIIHADIFKTDTSLKLLLTLEGGQKAIFKIKTQEKLNKLNDCNYGCEHPEYEVAGFTLNRMFGLRNMPYVSGRKLSWFEDINPVATPVLRKFVQVDESNSVCLNWTCWNTHRTSRFCFDNGKILGVMIYYMQNYPVKLFPSRKNDYHRYHLYGIHDKRNLERRLGDKSFCLKFRQNEPYNEDAWFLDIIDISVVDYIMSHDDSRHTFIGDVKRRTSDDKSETDQERERTQGKADTRHSSEEEEEEEKAESEEDEKEETTGLKETKETKKVGMHQENEINKPLLNIIYDYGAAFCKFDHLKILAPLLQCCRIRTRLYEAMIRHKKTFIDTFQTLTEDDPLYPVLLPRLLKDMKKKFEQTLAYIESCMNLDGKTTVLIDL